MVPFESVVHDKKFAAQLATMIDSRLVWYKHYYYWADELIASIKNPPYWLIEIATIKYYPDAVAAINRFIFSEPWEQVATRDDEYIACLYLRFRVGQISWASFLDEAGRFSDGANGETHCEYFYQMLNLLEDSEYSVETEAHQAQLINAKYEADIRKIGEVYQVFLKYFRRYVEDHPSD